MVDSWRGEQFKNSFEGHPSPCQNPAAEEFIRGFRDWGPVSMSEPLADESTTESGADGPTGPRSWMAFRLGLLISRLRWFSTQLYLWPTEERAIATLGELTRLQAFAFEESLGDVVSGIVRLKSRISQCADYLIESKENSDPRYLGSGNKASWRAYRGEYDSMDDYFEFWDRAPGEIPLIDLEDCAEFPKIAVGTAFGDALKAAGAIVDEVLSLFEGESGQNDEPYFAFGSLVGSGASPDPIRWLLRGGLMAGHRVHAGNLLTDVSVCPAGMLPPEAGWLDQVRAAWARLRPSRQGIIEPKDRTAIADNAMHAVVLTEELFARVELILVGVPASLPALGSEVASRLLEVGRQEGNGVEFCQASELGPEGALRGKVKRRSRSRASVESPEERNKLIAEAILTAPPNVKITLGYLRERTGVPEATSSGCESYKRYRDAGKAVSGTPVSDKSVRTVDASLESVSSHGRSLDTVKLNADAIKYQEFIGKFVDEYPEEQKDKLIMNIINLIDVSSIDAKYYRDSDNNGKLRILCLMAKLQKVAIPSLVQQSVCPSDLPQPDVDE